MTKRGERSMMGSMIGSMAPEVSGSGVASLILLGVAALALLAFLLYRFFYSPTKLSHQNNLKEKIQNPTQKDRELLELIGDLAELYRKTGR